MDFSPLGMAVSGLGKAAGGGEAAMKLNLAYEEWQEAKETKGLEKMFNLFQCASLIVDSLPFDLPGPLKNAVDVMMLTNVAEQLKELFQAYQDESMSQEEVMIEVAQTVALGRDTFRLVLDKVGMEAIPEDLREPITTLLGEE